MRNLVSIFLCLAFASAILIGCDLVGTNGPAVTTDDATQVEASYDGYFATEVDTMGYEDPP